jgi:hypothetical protein
LLAANHFARYVILMTGRDSISHLCLAALLAGCASVPQLDEAQPITQQAGAYPAFLSANDLRAAVGTDLNSQPAEELSGTGAIGPKGKGAAQTGSDGRVSPRRTENIC